MSELPFLDDTISLLDRTPRVVHELLTGLPDTWLGEPDVAGGWTAWDVVGHLISNELDNFMPRAETILRDGTSQTFAPFNRLAHLDRDQGLPLGTLIVRFRELRARNIGRLSELVRDGSDLDRRGLHPDFGEVTLRQLLSTWTVHDLDHVAQIYSALAGARDKAVGPWKAYLGILTRRDPAP